MKQHAGQAGHTHNNAYASCGGVVVAHRQKLGGGTLFSHMGDRGGTTAGCSRRVRGAQGGGGLLEEEGCHRS